MNKSSVYSFTFTARIWRYPGEIANWYFVTLPQSRAKEIRRLFLKKVRGWGSLPVSVKLRSTHWDTSIFPDKKTESYLLPIKATIRKRERIIESQTLKLSITIKA